MAFLPRQMQKLVIIVRTDINMGQGKIAAQCAHAAINCYRKGNGKFFSRFSNMAWILTGQPKVVLKAGSEKELLELSETAEKAGLITDIIKDAGKTQLKSGTITVLGIGPGSADRIDSVTSHLKLL